MRPTTRQAVVCAVLVVFGSWLALGQGTKVPPDNRPPSESERDHPQERAEWFLRGRTVNGRPAARELERAHQQKRENRRLHAAGGKTTGTQTVVSSEATAPGASAPIPTFVQSVGGPSWIPLGPAPTATVAFGSNQQDYGPAVGRATAVVVDQSDPSGNTVYVGGASGGLWKSTNAGSFSQPTCNGNGVCTANPTWKPLIDNRETLTVGSIALSPANTDCGAVSPLNCVVLVGTGEANNSADSYYGLGILRSTDGGTTWNLISGTSDGAYNFHGLGFTHIAFSTDNTSMVAATAAAASGGLAVGAETGGSGVRGIYFSTNAGQSWSRATVLDGTVAPDAGSANAVVYNAAQHKFYANIRYHGVYVSDNCVTGTCAANWSRLATQPANLTLTSCPSSPFSSGCPLYRAEMAVVPGRDEMYVWIVQADQTGGSNDVDRGIYQTLNGGQSWTAISTSGIDTCGDSNGGCGTGSSSQATYNITLAAIPNGTSATDLYAGGVNQYKCVINPATNPTCAAQPFLNLTHVYGCTPTANIAHVHPDEHGIDFLGNDGTGAFFAAHPTLSPPVFFANDGGIYRVLASSSLNSGSCPTPPAIPPSPFDNLSLTMGSMIQFVWFSQHPSDTTTLFGGTQDNGSPGVSSAAPSLGNWLSINNGDGGFNDINPLNPNEWFTSNPTPWTGGPNGSAIFRCTSGISCTNNEFLPVIDQSMLGGDNSPFYTNFMLDPQVTGAVPGAGRMIVGTCRVWRGYSDGTGSDWSVNSSGGNPLSNNFDTLSATACASSAQNMVTALAAGGPCNGTCNPGANPGLVTGGGSQVLWAGTDGDNTTLVGGQVWVTTNADGGPTTWTRVDGAGQPACTATAAACNINPKHYPISGIAVDPHDATGRTAYVTVMGFGAGHVFKTTNAGQTWALLDGVAGGTGLPDNPADAVVVDPTTPSLVYVATDVGVFQSVGDGTWTELGPSSGPGALPNVATTALHIFNSGGQVRLRVSTYGRGLWDIPLTGFSLSVPIRTLYTFPNQDAVFQASVNASSNFTNPINISCQPGETTAPPTCTPSPASVTTPGATTPVTVTTRSASVADFSFNLNATGTDPQTLQTLTQVPLTLHVVDFSMGTMPSATVGASNAASVDFNVTAQGAFTGNVALACSGQPTGSSCNFSPSAVNLTPGATVSVSLIIPTSASTSKGPYTVTITGSATLGTATQTHTTSMSLTVNSAAQSFTLSGVNPLSPSTIKPGQAPLTGTVQLSSGGTYTGTVTLACAFDSAADSPGNATCSVCPGTSQCAAGATSTTSLTLGPPQTQTAAVTINTTLTGTPAGNPRVNVTAIDANNALSPVPPVVLGYSVTDYAVSTTTPGALVPGGSMGVGLSLVGLNGYSSTVAVQCNPPLPLTCSLSPAGPYTVTGSTIPITATIAAPTGTTATSYSVNVNSSDSNFPALTHNQALSVNVQDYQINATPAASVIKAGDKPTFTISATALGGFSGEISLTASGCPSTLPTDGCEFSATRISGGGSVTLTIKTTAATLAAVRPASGPRGAPLYALWLTMPGMAMVLIGVGAAPRRQRRKLLACLGLTLALAVILMLPACGGGGGSSTTSPPVPKPGTPAGKYTVTVSGTSGSGGTTLSHTATITLTVQ